MKIIIYRNREVYKENSKIGNDSENKVETLDFEFPEEFKDFNKYIEFQIKGEKCVDLIRNNQYVITRSIAKYGKIKTQIVLKKIIDNDTVVFKSNIFTVNVSASINASEGIEQTLQVDIIQTLSQNISEIENKVADLKKDKADKTEIPTVPNWAKQEEKPTYTASEIAFEDGETFQEKYNSGELEGQQGKSAYGIWLEQGNEGTEAEFIASLKGEQGKQGEQGIQGPAGPQGEKGADGKNGISATHSWNGTVLTITSASGTSSSDLKGDKGDTGPQGIQGTAGQDGKNGIDGKNYSVEVVESTTTTLEIQPNKFYKFGEVTELNLTLAEITDNTQLNEFMFEFISGETATTLTLPDTIKWLETPTIEANKIYQCSIVNNIGILVGVANV